MPAKRKGKAYSDGPGVAANDKPKPWDMEALRGLSREESFRIQHEWHQAEFLQGQKEIASDLGLTPEQWAVERERRLEEMAENARARRVLDYKPSGPFLDGSEEWHEAYKALCMANVTAILAGQMTRQEAANAVLDRFPRLSDSARAMWCRLANSAPERAGIEINPVWKEGTKHAPAAGVRELSPRAAELAKEILSEVERKMRIGAA